MPYQPFKILILDHNLLQSSRRHIYLRKIRPHGMRLTAEAVKTACIAVPYQLIELSRPVSVTESAEQSFLMKSRDPIKVLAGIKDVLELVFELIRFIPDAAVQICKV